METKPYAFFSSFEKEIYGSYGSEEPIRIVGCEGSKNKFLMVANAPSMTNLKYETSYSFNNEFEDDKCVLQNFPFEKPLTFQSRIENYQANSLFFKKCIQFEITDSSRVGISYPEEQPGGCAITRLSEKQAIARGGFCYFDIKRDSSFEVKYLLNEECQGMSSESLNVFKDIDAIIGIYVAGDASGHSVDLTPLKFNNLRFSTNPPETIVKSSNAYHDNLPGWPTQIAYDLVLGEIKIEEPEENETAISVPFVINHTCGKKCDQINGKQQCISLCDYPVPLAASLTLEGLDERKKWKSLHVWYRGGVVPAQWQGFFPAEAEPLQTQIFGKYKSYRLHIVFVDPTSLYSLIKNNVQKFYVPQMKLSGKTIGRDSLTPYSGLEFKDRYKTIPEIPTIESILDFTDPKFQEKLNKQLTLLNSYLYKQQWPPYILDFCDQNNFDHCVSAWDFKKPFLEFFVDIKKDHQSHLSVGAVERKSEILKNFTLENTSAPKVDCGL